MEPTKPTITTTTTNKDFSDDNPPQTYTVTEIEYRLNKTDQVWLGLSSLTVQRGDRWNDGEEYVLRIGDYTTDLVGQAVLELVREQKRVSENAPSGDFLQGRASRFLAELRDLL